jgi:nucleotide-binding universal stress UspA family protein
MDMYKNILVPLDGSAVAEQALPLAVGLARRAGAALDLVRVHVLYALADPGAAWLPYDPSEDAAVREQELTYLTEVAQRCRGQTSGPVSCAVGNGLTADGILERARETAADLIVMTTHGAGPVSRAFLGSTADELVRRAPVPVLLTRPRRPAPDAAGEPAVRRILIPLDGSPASELILRPALALARLAGASCTLFHVAEPSTSAADQVGPARDYLAALVRRLPGQAPEVRTRVVVGRHAATCILEEARGYDLIALATHGRGGLKRLLLGSVADKVLRGAGAPLLLARQDDQAASLCVR